MAEGKYGRLFTERDVRLLVRHAYERGRNCEAGIVLTPGEDVAGALIHEVEAIAPILEETLGADAAACARLTFPADEPLFLLRGQDLAAHNGAWSYAYEASRIGAPVEFVTEALKRANDLRDWAAKNRDRMKIPD